MNWVGIAKKIEKLVIDNSPSILTAIGVTGTLTTAYLTGSASFKAAKIIHNELVDIHGEHHKDDIPIKEKFRLVWKFYIPPAGVGIMTIVCIVSANRIGAHRAAAVAAAYSISEKAFLEYKEKVVEQIGTNKEQKVRDDLAQDRVNANPVSEREVIITGNGEVLCFDAFTGRYFNSSMEGLKKAQNNINAKILHDSYASLSDFYNEIDIPTTSYSDEVGWTTDKLLELEFSGNLSENDRPCISVDFRIAPVRDYWP